MLLQTPSQDLSFNPTKGNEYIILGGLKDFCANHNISYATMTAAIQYNRIGPRKNGWTISYDTKNTQQ